MYTDGGSNKVQAACSGGVAKGLMHAMTHECTSMDLKPKKRLYLIGLMHEAGRL